MKLWIPLVILTYSTQAWLSWKANNGPWQWTAVLYAASAFPVWPLVVWCSRDLVYDALLFDVLMAGSFYVTLLAVGAAESMTPARWLAGAMVLGGLLLWHCN